MKLVELATSASLLGIVSVACATLVHSQTQLLRNVSERAAMAETLRTASGIFAAEIDAAADQDLRAVTDDSVAMRIMRGQAIVEARVGQRYALRYEGLRDPDPLKDSILVVGTEHTASFTLASADPPSIETDLPLAPGALVLFFESGAYHIATNALRYRRGAEGRQPVTDELIDHRASRFGVEAEGRLLLLHLRGRNTLRQKPVVTETRVHRINRPP